MKQNKHTPSFSNRRLILGTVSLLNTAASANKRTLKVRSSAKEFWITSFDSSVLETESRPFRPSSCNDSRPLWNFYAIQTHLFQLNILHGTHLFTFQTVE